MDSEAETSRLKQLDPSLKPLPSASLSKNLLARLNQLSEPVTRKLKFWNKKSFQVNQYDPCFKVIYLGNLGIQFWSKDESCLEKPLNTLWNNYLVNMKTEIIMRLTICNSGLKAITRQHGLTQYWSNRLVYCCSHKNYPKIFAWIYRHEGKKMRQELRCHAVFCSSPERAAKMVSLLSQRLACALQEFKREKKSRGGGPLPILPPPTHSNSIGGASHKSNNKDGLSSSSSSTTALMQRSLPRTVPLRRQILAKGSANFRPPLERSKSAPKLTSIREEEDYESETESESDSELVEIRNHVHDEDTDREDIEHDCVKNSVVSESRDRTRNHALVGDKITMIEKTTTTTTTAQRVGGVDTRVADTNFSAANADNLETRTIPAGTSITISTQSPSLTTPTLTETPNGGGGGVDESTTQDIILSWSNNLLIK